jgi:NADH-quinone oxidoreductase subunit I
MPNIIREIADSAAALAKGFTVTFKNLLGPTVTENYPAEPVHFEDRYRGIHILRRDENGLEKCVACFLCAAACPANCIYIEAAENTAENRISAAERYAKAYDIDYNRCIFCGYCVEACPCDAITHGQGFEIAAYDTNALVWRKEQLLEPAPAQPEPHDRPPRVLPNQVPNPNQGLPHR